MEIGKKLKLARSKARLTQETVATEINVSRQTISNWENEKSYPDIVSIINLSDLYNISLDELLKEDDTIIKHLEDSTNLVKNSKRLTISMTLWFVFITVILIIDEFFHKIPRISNLWINIFVMVLFFVGGLWYLFKEMIKKNIGL